MSKASDVLTASEMEEIARRRAKARARALAAESEITPEEDASTLTAAEADPDAQPLADEEWTRMRPAHEVHPHLVAAELRRGRGRPKSARKKVNVSVRLDPEIIEHFEATGAGWRTRINDALLSLIGKTKTKRKPKAPEIIAKPPRRRRAKQPPGERPTSRKSA